MNRVFISYVTEDSILVNNLVNKLKTAGIELWIDKDNLVPGIRWQKDIRNAIENGIYFLACFSQNYSLKNKSYMNKELKIAIEQLTEMPQNRIWFIPIKLSPCDIPDFSIGGNETLNDIQWVELHTDWNAGVNKLINVIKKDISKEIKIKPKVKNTSLIIEIDSNLDDFGEKGTALLKNGLAFFIGVFPSEIKVVSIKGNNVKVTLRLNNKYAKDIVVAFINKDLKLFKYVSPLKIINIKILKKTIRRMNSTRNDDIYHSEVSVNKNDLFKHRNDIPFEECGKKYLLAFDIESILNRHKKPIKPKDIILLRQQLQSIVLSDLKCTEFALWWNNLLYNKFNFTFYSNELLNIIVGKWFENSIDMFNKSGEFCNNKGNGFPGKKLTDINKKYLINPDEWIKQLCNALELNLQIRNILIKNLSYYLTDLPFLKADHYKLIINCLPFKSDNEVDFSIAFFQILIQFAKQHHMESLEYIDKLLEIFKECPTFHISDLSMFILNIPRNDKTVNKMYFLSNQVKGFIRKEVDFNSIAVIRKEQEKYMPYITGYMVRERRLSSFPTVSCTLAINNQNTTDLKTCTLLDVTSGDNSKMGFGICLKLNGIKRIKEEPFKRVHYEKMDLNIKKISASTSSSDLVIVNPGIKLSFGQNEMYFKTLSLRAIQYHGNDNSKGYGIVLYITKGQEEEHHIMLWQQYISERFIPVSYSDFIKYDLT